MEDQVPALLPGTYYKQKFVGSLFYIGHDYCGWQRQGVEDTGCIPDTVQERLEGAVQLSIDNLLYISVCSSGRTDAGTHASGQIVHFIVAHPKSDLAAMKREAFSPNEWMDYCRELIHTLNKNLPRDIRLMALFHFPTHFGTLPYFHAKKAVVKKQYSYYFAQGGVFVPEWAPFSIYAENFDIELLKQELSYIKGEHDFKNFVSSKGLPKKTKHTISEIELSILHSLNPRFPTDPNIVNDNCLDHMKTPKYLSKGKVTDSTKKPYVIRIKLVGTGFLKHMIRRLVGGLKQIQQGKAAPGLFKRILNEESKDNNNNNSNTTNNDNNYNNNNNNIRITRNKNHKKSCTVEKLGPALPSKALWLEKVWYGSGSCSGGSSSGDSSGGGGVGCSEEDGLCVNPEKLPDDVVKFTPFVDCSFSTQI